MAFGISLTSWFVLGEQIVEQRAALGLLVINDNLVGVVGLHNKSVCMAFGISLTSWFVLGEQIVAVVVENDVGALLVAADIRAKHNTVFRGATESLCINLRQKFNVGATTVGLNIMTERVLEHK